MKIIFKFILKGIGIALILFLLLLNFIDTSPDVYKKQVIIKPVNVEDLTSNKVLSYNDTTIIEKILQEDYEYVEIKNNMIINCNGHKAKFTELDGLSNVIIKNCVFTNEGVSK
jgi:hypothetical protein